MRVVTRTRLAWAILALRLDETYAAGERMDGTMLFAVGRFLALVGAGALGALTRHGVHSTARRLAPAGWPLGTLAINVGGAFAIGVVLGWPGAAHASARAVLATGFLGGFTTFGTLTLETWTLGTRGRHLAAWAYALGSVVAGLVAVWAGIATAAGIVALAAR
ncbi:MAG TPA: CrcB family protein [Ktedonobacterales bacterium]